MLHALHCILSNWQDATTLTLLNILFYLLFPNSLVYLICLVTLTFLDLFIWIPFTLKLDGVISEIQRGKIFCSLKKSHSPFYEWFHQTFWKFNDNRILRARILFFCHCIDSRPCHFRMLVNFSILLSHLSLKKTFWQE